MIVRPRVATDLDALEPIAEESHRLDGYPVRGEIDMRAFIESAGALAAWVACDVDGAVIGNVVLNERSSPAVMAHAAEVLGHDRIAVVARLLVARSARRSGVAAALLRTAADDARARGLHPILDVVATSAGPRALYEREGWRDVGTVTAVFSDGFSIDETVYVAP